MIWAAPVALAGIALLALPILIHLMGLGRARTRQFPSLRFLEGSRLLPSRRTRIHDAILLFVRLVVLSAAVVALARPLVPGRAATTAYTGRAIAVIVDTSASVKRAAAGSGGDARIDASDAITTARAIADSLAAGGMTTLTVLTASPADEIGGAVAWLRLQPGDRELAIVSDFQVGAVAAGDLASVSPSVAVRAVRVPLRAPESDSGSVETSFDQDARRVVARATVTDGRTQIAWSSRQAAGGQSGRSGQPTRLAAPTDAPMVESARRAALVVGRPVGDPGAFTIVYPGAPGRADLVRNGAAPHEIWHGDAVQRLRGDSLLAVAANDATPTATDSIPTGAAIIARTRNGEPVVAAVADSNSLVLLLRTDAASLVSVALNAAVARVAAPDPAELDPAVLSDSAVRSLERNARPTPAEAVAAPAHDNAPSYARWFWIVALVGLAGEAMLRRMLASKPLPTVVNDVAR